MQLDAPVQSAGTGEFAPARLAVGGYVPFTTIDFPGRLAAVVFLRGCPWRCPYCHNAGLQAFAAPGEGEWKIIRQKLEHRRGLLDGVVFSGGEPTAQRGLAQAMREVRAMGFAVGLHTSGAYPGHLEQVLPLVEWVGLDIKAPPDERYDRLCGKAGAWQDFLETLEILRRSGCDFTLRTTVDDFCTSNKDWQDILDWVQGEGLPPPVRQEATLQKKSRKRSVI